MENMIKNEKLSKRVAVVSGGAKNIGKGIAFEF